MKLYTVFEYDELVKLQTGCIIECWHRREFGKGKRAWVSEFSKQERDLLNKYYGVIYSWHMVKGIPQEAKMKPSTYRLLGRAASFFSQI